MNIASSPSLSMIQSGSSENEQDMSARQTRITEPVVAKRLHFYKSGDPQFSGLKMVISNRSFKTFDALLDNLSKKVPLPFGVRNISTPRGIHSITKLDDLEDGKSYICSQKKKVKPINLEQASKKPIPWYSSRPMSARRRVAQLARQNKIGALQQYTNVAIKSPRKLVVFKNGDPAIKHIIILNKKTAHSFDALLDYITEVMQFPVTKLYTQDGRRVDGMQALILCSGVVVAASREPFKNANYDFLGPTLPAKLPGISNRVYPKPSRKESKNRIIWKVSVVTSDSPSASTTAHVYIILYGNLGNSGYFFLYSSDDGAFHSNHEDTFTISTANIGELYKIRIGHDNSGESPSWHCKEIWLQNFFSGEEFHFSVCKWLSQDKDSTELCCELPVSRHGLQSLPATVYEVIVVTGDLWNAGTEATIYISIYGEKGDTGSRMLFRSRNSKKFLKGQTDLFFLEAVYLGYLYKVVVGHDGLGAGNGWYLDKIVIKDPTNEMEYTFFCHRWLDQGQEDKKIVRELYLADSFPFPESQELEHKRKETWNADKWKFQEKNILQLYCNLTEKFIRLYPDGTVDALGDKKDKYSVFEVVTRRGHIRVFNSLACERLALAVNNGCIVGQDNRSITCEMRLHPQPNHCIILESVWSPGQFSSFSDKGIATDATNECSELAKEFTVHVKGVFHDKGVILLCTSLYQALSISSSGSCCGTEEKSEEAYLRVHKVSTAVYMFESVQYPKMFLRMEGEHCDGKVSSS
ncbi:oxygen-regulated protein 1 [Protopterus annectens]|uniref:oxygen-regulated protein 1 n=1 Tax=Protopterus annectens TaxID=7888 RepID=UPI001CF95328|nr:oxygen-regulated protein 1 [Protopterus annectens]